MLRGTRHISPVATSAVRIFDARGDVVGAGFVVGPGQVATCAHVVCAALGGSPEDPATPPGCLRVDLPLLGSPHASEAVVRTWRPIDPTTGVGDVAILELSRALPSAARVPPLHRPDLLWGHRFRVLGFPAGMQDGIWTAGTLRDRQGTRWLQLQSDPHSPPVAQGFSGAPVWDEEVEAVVGMTVASDVRAESTTAYLLPIEDVLGVDPRLLPNPYRGLEPFGEEHTDVFYGRDDEVGRLEALLDRRPVVAVVGRSGTGKSSLVRAGLLPRLRRRGVRIVELRLGPADASPAATLDRLADSLATLATEEPDLGVLLFADQFEELVGMGPSSEETTPAQEVLSRLVDLVRYAPRRPDGAPSLRVVLTLRWEAMNELLTDDVVETFDQGTFSLAAMSRDQLRRAIVGPTARAPGLDFDPGLVERILDDAVAEPGQLPLVESLLTQLWASRLGGTLKTTAYEQIGGVKGAVARHAEQAVAQLTSPDNGTGLRRLFTTLARPDDSGGFIRRPALLDGLPSEQRQIVESLARSRLVVVGQEADGRHTVELAHQALIDYWPRLRDWLDEDREFLGWQHEVDRQRQVWDSGGQDHGALLRGTALIRATEWLGRRARDIPPALRAFVETSAAVEARQRRRTRLLRAGLGFAAAVALVLGTFAVQQRSVAREEQAISSSRDLATLAADTAAADPALSMLLALEAYQRHPTPEAEDAMFRHYLDYLAADTVLSGAQGQIADLDISSDGRAIVTRTSLGNVTVWTREPGRPVAMHAVEAPLAFGETAERGKGDADNQASAVALSEDGLSLVVVGARSAWIYDVETGDIRAELPVSGDEVRGAELHDDGAVFLQFRDESATRLELWDTEGTRPTLVGALSLPPSVNIRATGFGPEPGTVVVDTADFVNDPDGIGELLPANVVVWDAATGATETIAHDPVTTAVTPDGVVVTCRDADDTLTLERLDLRSGAIGPVQVDPRGSPDAGSASCLSMAVSPDGAMAVVDDGALAVDLRTGEATALTGPSSDYLPYPSAVVADDERYLTVVADETRVVLTEVLADDEFQVGLPDDAFLTDVEPAVRLLPDGDHVVSVADDGHALVVARTPDDGVAFEAVAAVDRPAPYRLPGLGDLTIDRSGSLVADRVADDRVEVRRLPDLDLVAEVTTPLPEPPHTVTTSIDPDEAEIAVLRSGVAFHGDRLVTFTTGAAQWWNPSTGELVDELDLVEAGIVSQDDVDSGEVGIMFHADPTLVAVTVAGDTDLQIVDIETGRQVDTFPVGSDVLAATFQEDGHHLAVYRRGGTVEVWDVDRQQPVIGPLTGYESQVAGFVPTFVEGTDQFFVAFGGGFLGRTGTLRWFQVGSSLPERALDLGVGQSVQQTLPIDVDQDVSLMLASSSPTTGSRLDAVVAAVQLDPRAWQDKLCDLVDQRTFTDDEITALLDGDEPHTLC